MAEILVIGTPSEDKKPKFQFLDSDGNIIALTDLLGYGVMLHAPNGSLIGKFGKNITGYSEDEVNEVDTNTIEVVIEGNLIPMTTGHITARTVVKFTDADFSAGYRIDYSKERQILYTIERV